MKLHYFDQKKPDSDDYLLKAAIGQGYVKKTCKLGGQVVNNLVMRGKNPCKGCAGEKECNGSERIKMPRILGVVEHEPFPVVEDFLEKKNASD